MRRVILYIAMSLDGYLADPNGGVDWLTGQDTDLPEEDRYADFEQQIDTVILGWNTYHQIVTELSPERWVYDKLDSYVLTHRACQDRAGITFTDRSLQELVAALRQKPGKDIWLCGGADVIRQAAETDLIDAYRISVIPTILGDGIRLFGKLEHETKLRLVSCSSKNGIAELIYERR